MRVALHPDFYCNYTPLSLQVQKGNFEEESLHTVDCIDLSNVKCDVQEAEKGIICSKYIPRPDHAGERIKKKGDSAPTNQRTEHFLSSLKETREKSR